MTLVNVGRSFEISKTIPEISSITEPSEVDDEDIDDFIEDFKDFVPDFIKKHYPDSIKYSFNEFHCSMSSGPNGPALRSSLWEAHHMPQELLEMIGSLPGDLRSRIEFLRDGKEEYLGWYDTFNLKLNPDKEFRFGKISAIPDKEGKTRVIALMNY